MKRLADAALDEASRLLVNMAKLALSLDSSCQFRREFIPDPPCLERSPIGVQGERIPRSRATLIGELARQSELCGRFAHRIACIADPIAWIGRHLYGQSCP